MSWDEFLSYALTPAGIGVIIGVILSFVVEYVPGYVALDPKWKRLVYLGLAFVIPLVITILDLASTGGSWGDWEGAWWPALVSGFVAFTSGTVVHTRKLKSCDD